MVEQQMWDPVGKYITELRDDTAVAAIVAANPTEAVVPRVRSPEPAAGDAQGPGQYRAFVVLVSLVLQRHPQVPVQRPRHAVRCYGRTPEEAAQLYAACSAVLHGAGPRQTGSGNGIYVSHDDTGGSYDKDPDTGQPFYQFIIESLATTQAVTP